MVPFLIIYLVFVTVMGGLIMWGSRKELIWTSLCLTVVSVWVLIGLTKDTILLFTHQSQKVTGTFTRIEPHFHGEFVKVYVYGEEVNQLYFIHQPSVAKLEGYEVNVKYLPSTHYGVVMKKAPIQQPL